MGKLGGSFQRRSRLADPRQRSKPLEKSEEEKKWLSQVPPGSPSGARLGGRDFKAAPKVPELPPGFLPARACVPGDRIVAAADYGDVILEVVEVAPWMVVCRDIRTGKVVGVLPGVICQVAS